MRKIVGLVSIGLGVALIALAIALPSYVYPRVAKLPADPDQYVVAEGSGITVLLAQSTDDGGIRVLDNQHVTVTRRVRAEPRGASGSPANTGAPNAGAETPDGSVFWRLAFQTVVADQPKGLLTAYVEGASLDAKTGEANNCCDDYVSTDPSSPVGDLVKHEGYVFKFPFNTEKTNYPFWDVNIKKSTTATYQDTETIEGLKTYRFVQKIPDVVISKQEVPGSLMQLPDQPSVTADRVYSTTRTMWVEPRTGAIIKGSEQVDQRLVFEGKQTPVIKGTITYNADTIRRNVDEYGDASKSLWFVQSAGPIGGWVLGVLLLLVGIALVVLSGRKPKESWDDEDEHEDVPSSPKQKI
jgi:hypothetical protein